MKPERNEANLPVWARHQLERLRRDLAAAQAEVQRMVGAEPSLIQVDRSPVSERPPLYLSNHAQVTFRLSSGWVTASLDSGQLVVRGQDMLAVLPRAANVIHVIMEGRPCP